MTRRTETIRTHETASGLSVPRSLEGTRIYCSQISGQWLDDATGGVTICNIALAVPVGIRRVYLSATVGPVEFGGG